MRRDILKYFGCRVRAERANRGISQEEFADMVGVHRTYIGMIERAEKNVTLRNIEKIARALEIEISELFDGYRNNTGFDESEWDHSRS
ncbi:MAG: helix-turn-helix transcriptional regulator [Anaerolineae bacterium]|nr:helix-turn-helix transcriptional regulator [Anaerolineae bacterium]